MAVTYCALPSGSRLGAMIKPKDFVDCVFGAEHNPVVPADKAAFIAMAQMPDWVNSLMRLRNLLVMPFGLKTGRGNSFSSQVPASFEVGQRIGVFKVTHVDENEIIMGEDDRHLNFRVSVFRDSQGYYLATWVHPHNLLGRAYLSIVMPFHRLITQNCMKRLLASMQAPS